LINKGANINIKCKYGVSPFHNACDNNNINIVQLLINKGAQINCIDDFNNAPINHAITPFSLKNGTAKNYIKKYIL
jgi:ankyrin repeat protein